MPIKGEIPGDPYKMITEEGDVRLPAAGIPFGVTLGESNSHAETEGDTVHGVVLGDPLPESKDYPRGTDAIKPGV